MKYYSNFKKCKSCGGKCCEIYSSKSKFYSNKNLLEIWMEGFFVNANIYEISPIYDAYKVHIESNKEYISLLDSNHINTSCCQFCGKDGCIIEWDNRPIQCKNYICDDWYNL